jgi:hypothetical protein
VFLFVAGTEELKKADANMSRKLFFTVEIIFYIGTEELKKAEGKYL